MWYEIAVSLYMLSWMDEMLEYIWIHVKLVLANCVLQIEWGLIYIEFFIYITMISIYMNRMVRIKWLNGDIWNVLACGCRMLRLNCAPYCTMSSQCIAWHANGLMHDLQTLHTWSEYNAYNTVDNHVIHICMTNVCMIPNWILWK